MAFHDSHLWVAVVMGYQHWEGIVNVKTRRLLYDNSKNDVRDVAQHVFGLLAEIAQPVIHSYHSDLSHDALWLKDYLQGEEFRFVWSVGGCGTWIADDENSEWAVTMRREHLYRITVRVKKGSFTADVEGPV